MSTEERNLWRVILGCRAIGATLRRGGRQGVSVDSCGCDLLRLEARA